MDRKIVFFDLDGTIIENGGQYVSEKDSIAITKLRNNGHLAFICTGRAPGTISKNILDVGFDGLIAGGGAFVSYDNNILKRSYIDRTIVKRFASYYLKSKEECILECEDFAISLNLPDWPGRPLRPLKDISELDTLFSQTEVIKATALRTNMDVHNMFSDDLIVHLFHYGQMEFLPKGSSKSEGIRIILETLKADVTDTIAFGDSANDLDMMRFVNIAVAMGNASDEVKDLSNFVTESVDDSGVSLGLKKLGLI